MDVFVRKVRGKLKALSPDWSYIHTHFGIGYRFQPEPTGGEPSPAAAKQAESAPAEAGATPADTGSSERGGEQQAGPIRLRPSV